MVTKNSIKSYHRVITDEIKKDIESKSLLLLGPRQTGKSTLLRASFPEAKYFNLLEADTLRQLSFRLESLREQVSGGDFSIVIIDEIQKLPELFDEVQAVVDKNPRLRFILTGSSARKLKRGKANLLGGRLWTRHLHPLTSREFGLHQLDRVLKFGALPSVLNSQDPKRDLYEYVSIYLKEEIQDEGLTRSLPQFSRFIDTVSHLNAKQINFTEVGNDAQISPRTVHDHFQILLDTLLGFTLPVFQKTRTRKAVATEKFYLFDIGVANSLCRRFEVEPRTPLYGDAVEHFVFLELRAFIDYFNIGMPLHYWRSKSKMEVDFILNEKHAIEVKAKESVHSNDLKGLRALMEEKLLKTYTCVTLEEHPRTTEDGIEILPLALFLERLWTNHYS